MALSISLTLPLSPAQGSQGGVSRDHCWFHVSFQAQQLLKEHVEITVLKTVVSVCQQSFHRANYTYIKHIKLWITCETLEHFLSLRSAQRAFQCGRRHGQKTHIISPPTIPWLTWAEALKYMSHSICQQAFPKPFRGKGCKRKQDCPTDNSQTVLNCCHKYENIRSQIFVCLIGVRGSQLQLFFTCTYSSFQHCKYYRVHL